MQSPAATSPARRRLAGALLLAAVLAGPAACTPVLAMGGASGTDGVRFGTGGQWKLQLSVDTPAGAYRVTFNLSL